MWKKFAKIPIEEVCEDSINRDVMEIKKEAAVISIMKASLDSVITFLKIVSGKLDKLTMVGGGGPKVSHESSVSMPADLKSPPPLLSFADCDAKFESIHKLFEDILLQYPDVYEISYDFLNMLYYNNLNYIL